MPLTWTPLPVPAAATPEEAFAVGTVHSHDSKIILLAWVKNVGWCGVRYADNVPNAPPPPLVTLLLRVDDVAVFAGPYRISDTLVSAGGNNANP